MFVDDAKLTAFVPSINLERARSFYRDTLGLELLSEDPFGLIFAGGGARMRVAKLESFTPIPGTAVGWSVSDIAAAIDVLVERGVTFIRYPCFEQDERGIWISPDGRMKIAWFHDPDGNTLSLSAPNQTQQSAS